MAPDSHPPSPIPHPRGFVQQKTRRESFMLFEPSVKWMSICRIRSRARPLLRQIPSSCAPQTRHAQPRDADRYIIGPSGRQLYRKSLRRIERSAEPTLEVVRSARRYIFASSTKVNRNKKKPTILAGDDIGMETGVSNEQRSTTRHVVVIEEATGHSGHSENNTLSVDRGTGMEGGRRDVGTATSGGTRRYRIQQPSWAGIRRLTEQIPFRLELSRCNMFLLLVVSSSIGLFAWAWVDAYQKV